MKILMKLQLKFFVKCDLFLLYLSKMNLKHSAELFITLYYFFKIYLIYIYKFFYLFFNKLINLIL